MIAIFLISAFRSPGLVDERLGVIYMVDFKAHKPFQYRVLMPSIIKLIELATPEPIRDKFDSVTREKLAAKIETAYPLLDKAKVSKISRYGYRVIIAIIMNTLILTLFMIILRRFALVFDVFSERLCDFLPVGMIFIMPMFFDYNNMIYDFPHLVLFTTGLILLYKKQWRWYFLIYALAILNKESAVMLAVVYAVNYYSDLPSDKYKKYLLLQIGIFIVIKAALFLIFFNNPGGVVETHIKWNIVHLIRPVNYFWFAPIGKGILLPVYLNIPVPHGHNLPVMIVVAAAVIYRWKEKPLFLRRATIYFIPLFFIAMIVGVINELRAYYDAMPIIYVLGMIGVVKFIENRKLKKPIEVSDNDG
jgi:hypothetical protein